MIAVGCDLSRVERFERLMEKEHFLRRVFTEGELAFLAGKTQAAQSAAGLWAAKEACAKALGTGFRGFGPIDIEIGHDGLGKPIALLHRGAGERMRALGGTKMEVSIAHDGGVALGVAVLE
ncbi:MAG: holo-ACP synthase [Christensenellaceae bacterium]|jgi:holo-[acyl-carrier protein] synthase|nr:holo-ACP synthase [Christensenellaceae bacterium]